jgi:hypothetical protein
MKRIERIHAYEKEIDKLENKIRRLQDNCKHKNVVKTHRGNTGNWDPNDDCYWTEFDCPECEKHWRENGSI